MEIKFSQEPLLRYENSPILSVQKGEQDSETKQPGIYATLLNSDEILYTYKIYQTEKDYFLYNKYIFWNSWIVIGCGGHVHFIKDLNNLRTFSLGNTSFSYFMEFYTSEEFSEEIGEDFLLVASGTSLSLFNEKAVLVWQVPELAVDGINVSKIEDSVIYGSSEQDPPGGWVEFEVKLTDGTIIAEPKYW